MAKTNLIQYSVQTRLLLHMSFWKFVGNLYLFTAALAAPLVLSLLG